LWRKHKCQIRIRQVQTNREQVQIKVWVDARIPNKNQQIRTRHFWAHYADDFVQADRGRDKEKDGVMVPDFVVRGDAN
jgi:hypothetical protein